jgi:hypothetical protein
MGHVAAAGVCGTLETLHNKRNVFIIYSFNLYKTKCVLKNLCTNRSSYKKHLFRFKYSPFSCYYSYPALRKLFIYWDV